MRLDRIGVVCVGLVLMPAGQTAAGECQRPCQDDFACEREVTECLIAAEQADRAIARLKERIAAQPDRPALKHLLAKAYHAAGNAFWAMRTLQTQIDADPADCDARAWLAWIQLEQGDLDLATETLAAQACPETQADRARWALLLSAIAQAGEDREAEVRLFEEFKNFDQAYPEDGRRYARQLPAYRSDWIEPVHLRAELSLGYTSNVSAGLPTTDSGADIGSPLLRLDLSGRFVWPLWRSVKPAVELSGKLHTLDDFRYSDEVDVRRANYFDGSVRIGLQLFFSDMHAFVGYRGDLFVLNSPDPPSGWGQGAPLPFFEANRIDLELSPGAGVTVFAGGGRRTFRRISRSRDEVDAGLGWSISLLDRLQLLIAVSVRHYRADRSLYDQTGGSGLLVGRVGLPAGLMLRAGLTAGLDHYPNAGEAGASSGRDLLVKPSLSLWSPSWAGVRLGLAYEYAWRDSTAEVSFSYTEHRTMLQVRWSFGANPWAPETYEPGGRVPLPWGGGGSGWDEERIQDLLRQDEAARRGSSCVN